MISIKQDVVFPALASEVRDELLDFPLEKWDRYDNPFEQKWVLKKPEYTEHMDRIVDLLTSQVGWIGHELVGSELDLDDGHYTAIFRYDVGDYLDLHFDAQRHPLNKKAKMATVLLYLSTEDVRGGNLEFWHGGNEPLESIAPEFNKLVAFSGPEIHGNPLPVLEGTRLVVTVSFLGARLEVGRERAYFMPRHGHAWDVEKFKLRDLRCDSEKYSEAYAVGGRE